MRRALLISVWIAALALGLSAVWRGAAVAVPSVSAADLYPVRPSQQALRPIPEVPEEDPARVALGRRLFHDAGLSADGSISCASCHDLQHGGDDGRETSEGIYGQSGRRNAPTVLNARFHAWQFWDGRAADLEEQVDGPLHDATEMGADWDHVLAYLSGQDEYVRQFRASYGGPPTRERVRDAIATFERTLVTPDAPLDRFLRGEVAALDASARRGFDHFRERGCVACHQGVGVGGNLYHRAGLVSDMFPADTEDRGRIEITGRPEDDMVFRVPSLRNVEHTAPYMHDGSIATLEDAVSAMARGQLGVHLGRQERDDIVAFLKALTGRLPDTVQEVGR